MSWRWTLVLWVIAGALVVAAIWLRATRAGAANAAEPVIDPALVQEAASIRFVDAGGTVELVHGGSTWRQSEPFAWPIDTLAVRDLLGALGRLTVVRRATDQQAPREAAPRLLIRDAAGNGLEVALEGRAPGGRAWIHARSIGAAGPGAWSRVTTRDHVHELLERSPPRSWRDPMLLGGLGAECTAIELRSPSLSAPIRVERSGSAWQLTSPAVTRAATAAVEGWMDALARLRANAFIRDTAERDAYGLGTPLAQLSIESSGAPAVTLVVGGEADQGRNARGRYARLEDTDAVVMLDEVALRRLEPSVLGLVEPMAARVRAPDVFGIRFVAAAADTTSAPGAAPAWELRRDGSAWSGERSEGHAAAVLHSLLDTPAAEIAFMPLPSGTIVGTIDLLGIDGETLARLVVARERDEANRWAVESEPGVLRVFAPSWGEGLLIDPVP